LYPSVLLKLTACLLYSSSLPLYYGRLLLSLGILLTYTDAARTRTYRKHITGSLSSQSIGALSGPKKSTCHVISKHCCVTSLRMRKLHRHKENTAAVLLVVCVAGVVRQYVSCLFCENIDTTRNSTSDPARNSLKPLQGFKPLYWSTGY
jgi:hypothetical protein